MGNTRWKQISLFILLIFLQILLFNKIHLIGYATPLPYIYILLKLPIGMSRNIVLLIAAFTGLMLDIFGFTLGLHMLACIVVGFLRYYLLRIFTPRDILGSLSPSFTTFDKGLFLRYAGIFTLTHHFVLFTTEHFSFVDPLNLVFKIAGSFVVTMIFIYALENITEIMDSKK